MLPDLRPFLLRHWKTIVVLLSPLILGFAFGWMAHGGVKPQVLHDTVKVVDEQEVQKRVDTEVKRRLAEESLKVAKHTVTKKVTHKDGSTVETTTTDVNVDKHKKDETSSQTTTVADNVINRITHEDTKEHVAPNLFPTWQVTAMGGVDFHQVTFKNGLNLGQPVFGLQVQRYLFTVPVLDVRVSGGLFVMSNWTGGLVLSGAR
jgi:hypothetical protein